MCRSTGYYHPQLQAVTLANLLHFDGQAVLFHLQDCQLHLPGRRPRYTHHHVYTDIYICSGTTECRYPTEHCYHSLTHLSNHHNTGAETNQVSQ